MVADAQGQTPGSRMQPIIAVSENPWQDEIALLKVVPYSTKAK